MNIYDLYEQIITFCGLIERVDNIERYKADNAWIVIVKEGDLPVSISIYPDYIYEHMR